MGKTQKPPTGRAAGYALLLPTLIAEARGHGYALAVHGSMQRDLDLIAAPWTDDAGEPESLVLALCARVGGVFSDHDDCPRQKPHGRLCWVIHFGGGMYLDVSVMPKTRAVA